MNETQHVLRNVGSAGKPYVNWFSNVPTPRGIMTLLIIIAIFLMAIVPVNDAGDTRLKLLWLTITSKTHLAYADQQQGQSGGPSTKEAYRVPIEKLAEEASNNAEPYIPPRGLDLFDGMFGDLA